MRVQSFVRCVAALWFSMARTGLSGFAFASTLALALALSPSAGFAQPPADEEELEDEELDDEELDEDLDEEDDLDEPQLRPPSLEMPDVGAEEEVEVEAEEEDEAFEDEGDEDEELDPADDMDLLNAAEPPADDSRLSRWTAPRSVLTLNGYFRTRGELWDNFFLGRGFEDTGVGRLRFNAGDGPFSRFVPADRVAAAGGGGCITGPGDDDDAATPCDSSDRIRFANMRLRLRPTIALSDRVKVHMMIDAFDNLVLGSTPENQLYELQRINGSADPEDADYYTARQRIGRAPGVPLDSFVTTQNPSMANRNSARDAIYMRRAWASVMDPSLGELRFGRMGDHWGLGILANGGDGIDSDFSTDVDRLQVMTKLAGFSFFGAYDFAAQGITNQLVADARDVPYDLSAKDDIRQYVVGAARMERPEDAEARLQEGGWVLEGGLRFAYRSQAFSTASVTAAYPDNETERLTFVQRDATAYMPDLWGRFRMGGLRLEVEAVGIFGSIGNVRNDSDDNEDWKIRQFGIAFEGAYRLLDEKLAIRLYTGFASGDADVEGLSARDGLLDQFASGNTMSTFMFHPNYRVDLILWRNIMQRVAGAWYLKPGVGYDILRNPFGQIFGVRADMIYSRAAQAVQSYSGDPNLGLELNFSLYYQSEDGPDLLDGFYASFQYGVLFPLAGLDFAPGDDRNEVLDVSNAQALRLILGVKY